MSYSGMDSILVIYFRQDLQDVFFFRAFQMKPRKKRIHSDWDKIK